MQKRVQGPATGLMITGALGILTSLCWLFALGIAVPRQIESMERELHAPVRPAVLYAFHGTGILINLAFGAFAIWASLQMQRLRQWVVCVIACFAAMVPCFVCCCLGIPVGVWGLVVLLNDEVKEAFTS